MASNKEVMHVDPETVNFMYRIKDEIISALSEKMKESNEQLERNIKENFNLQVDTLKQRIDTHKGYHDQHFSTFRIINETKLPEIVGNIKDTDSKISKAKEETKKEILDEISGDKRFSITTTISIISVLIALGAIIFSMVKG